MVEHPIATFPVHMLNIIQTLRYMCACVGVWCKCVLQLIKDATQSHKPYMDHFLWNPSGDC